ncbi:neuronal acetylcholine receptor subunit alpha-6-like [Anthonomus grandis grandis]|uniref:neuronal acetylcholine receptor subunit alpha-6-like n=1 Tax=Anthonomus grandis grandis TaxID=2921223 RepID=UPI00216505EC|nr:neuronal acetylcholine receptor subunit alpha-6-like [Anthonomus grandis grandis]
MGWSIFVWWVALGCLSVKVYPLSAFYEECPTASSSTPLYRLKSSILCDYDSYLRPVKDHRNVTTVSFRLVLKYFEYDHFSHTLSVDAWFTAFWLDHHLTWNPDDFEGIKTIHLSSSNDIWVPDISVYNRKDQSVEPNVIGHTTCSVTYKGIVLCVPPVHFDTLCVPNLKKYPYDTQTCTIRFGSWVQKGEDLNIREIKPMVDTEDLENNGEWELVSFKSIRHKGDNYTCCPNSTFPSIEVSLEIKRNSHTHSINLVLPLLVCILLTITTMAMNPSNKDRFILSCVSFISHIIHVQNLSYSLPITGENMPSILTISRDSTLLTGISVAVTVLLRNLMQNKNSSPTWMASATSVLIGSRPGQLIFLPDNSLKGAAAAQKQEDGDTIISSNIEIPASGASDWHIFAKFLDVLLFVSYLLVYFIILIRF